MNCRLQSKHPNWIFPSMTDESEHESEHDFNVQFWGKQ